MFKIIMFIFMFSSYSYASQKEELIYVKLPAQNFEIKEKEDNKAQVLYFFSYGCPYCYKADPFIKIYKEYIKDKNISFHYQPIEVQESWAEYAKAFYVGKSLKLDIHDNLYNDIHVNKNKIFSQKQLEKYFNVEYNTKPSKFSAAYRSSFNSYLLKGNEKKADKFNVTSTPTVVIISNSGDVYKFSPSINGDVLKMTSSMVLATEEILNNKLQENH